MLSDYNVVYGSNNVVLIKVGLNGDIRGYNDKYVHMTNLIHEKTNNTVIVASNPDIGGNKLQTDIETTRRLVPGCERIIYVGVSNGAVMGMQYAYLYPEIKEMILINGPLIMDWHKIKQGLYEFCGERITYIYGNKDKSYKYTELLEHIEMKTRSELCIVDGADHNFTGMEEEFINIPNRYIL